MKSRVSWSFVVGSALALSLWGHSADAVNTTCPNADFLFPGERALYVIPGNGNLFFKTNVVAGRSYAAIAWGPTTDVSELGVVLDVSLFNDNTCTTAAAGINGQDYEPLVTVPGHIGDHDSIIPTSSGPVYIRVNNGSLVGYPMHILFIETTLFSPWWFTGGSNNAYVEVRNNMSLQTTAQLTFFRANGSVCGTSDVNIFGNGNALVLINAVGTCDAAESGSAQIAFAGTPGGLTANITTIDGVGGTSFDSPFTPRMVWSIFTR